MADTIAEFEDRVRTDRHAVPDFIVLADRDTLSRLECIADRRSRIDRGEGTDDRVLADHKAQLAGRFPTRWLSQDQGRLEGRTLSNLYIRVELDAQDLLFRNETTHPRIPRKDPTGTLTPSVIDAPPPANAGACICSNLLPFLSDRSIASKTLTTRNPL